MKKQNTAVRRAALAVLYLAVFAAAVMYLRVTILSLIHISEPTRH